MKLLVTGAWKEARENIGVLEKLGHEVCFMQYEKDEIPCSYEWVEGVICNALFLSHGIERFINLKYIQLTSAGYDRVPLEYIKENNIQIHNARGVYSVPMAEFAICGVLELYKKMNLFRENQRAHVWEKQRDLQELFGKTVCIVGCGSVGNECAKRFSAFGCRVIGIDMFPRKDMQYDKIFELNKMKDVLPDVDILILTLPLTEQTYHFMNSDKFECMKKDAVLVNIARGSIVDTEALLKYMDKLCGAILDVFEEEPLQEESTLWNEVKIIVTPHNSFVGNNNEIRLNKIIVNNIKIYYK